MATESDPTAAVTGLDAVIAFYKRQVDRTALRKNLERTVQQRVDALVERLAKSGNPPTTPEAFDENGSRGNP